jgi:hypothetical protein
MVFCFLFTADFYGGIFNVGATGGRPLNLFIFHSGSWFSAGTGLV